MAFKRYNKSVPTERSEVKIFARENTVDAITTLFWHRVHRHTTPRFTHYGTLIEVASTCTNSYGVPLLNSFGSNVH